MSEFKEISVIVNTNLLKQTESALTRFGFKYKTNVKVTEFFKGVTFLNVESTMDKWDEVSSIVERVNDKNAKPIVKEF